MCALYWIWRISKQFIRVDIETATSKTSKKPGKTDQASKEGEAIEQQQHEDTEETESDEIVIPETLSEDAVFVSLSIPKQKEAGRYANDDPDWQQITQWATDPKAQQQVKSTWPPSSIGYHNDHAYRRHTRVHPQTRCSP